jgi:TonB family protein
MITLRSLVLGSCVWLTGSAICGQQAERPVSIAILDFGKSVTAQRSGDAVAQALLSGPAAEEVQIVDRDLSRTAARGVGYSGSLNLTVQEARDLGASIGCDFFLIGDAQTLRRSPSAGPVYFESYASVFLVSARTGVLSAWERPGFAGATPEEAEKLLLSEISKPETRRRYLAALRHAREDERTQRQVAVEHNTPVIAEASEEASDQSGLRLPRPYRRLRPVYPDTAARADAEGTVDVLVDLDQEGEVTRTEVVRWAGFGLDEATVNTVRQLHFFPALREGVPISIRILLRYNFRKPAR